MKARLPRSLRGMLIKRLRRIFKSLCEYPHVKLWKKIRKGGVGLLLAGACSVPAMSSVVDRPFFRAASVVIVFGASDFEENGGEAPIVFDFHVLDGATSGQAAPDLIGVDGRSINFNTQRFNPIQSGEGSGWEFQINDATFGGAFNSSAPHQTLDANDSYTAFGLDNTTDVDLLGNGSRAARFFVASNVPFDLFAQATNLVATGDFDALDYSNIRYRLRYQVRGGGGVNRWGQSAQDPAPSGNGVTYGGGGPVVTLEGLAAAPTKVFQGERRTARAAGSIMQQAVGFQSRYNLLGSAINGNSYDFSQGTGSLGADIVYTVYTP
jgi:hypothetical protein